MKRRKKCQKNVSLPKVLKVTNTALTSTQLNPSKSHGFDIIWTLASMFDDDEVAEDDGGDEDAAAYVIFLLLSLKGTSAPFPVPMRGWFWWELPQWEP